MFYSRIVLQDIGIAHICDGLAEQPNGLGLKSLNICNNHFSPASMNVIAIALVSSHTPYDLAPSLAEVMQLRN